MTPDQFNEAEAQILAEVPAEFHEAFMMMAWDIGHAYGMDEVLLHLRRLVIDLKDPIQNFGRRVQNECKEIDWG